MSTITHSTLPKPDMSSRRNRSLATVMNSQNQRMKMKTANASARKLAKLDSAENSIWSFPQSIAAGQRSSRAVRHVARSGNLAERKCGHAGSRVEADTAFDAHRLQGDLVAAAAEQHVGADADADGALRRGSGILAGDRARRDAARCENEPDDGALAGEADID